MKSQMSSQKIVTMLLVLLLVAAVAVGIYFLVKHLTEHKPTPIITNPAWIKPTLVPNIPVYPTIEPRPTLF